MSEFWAVMSCAILCILYGVWEASEDVRDIQAGRIIKHSDLWVERAVILFLLCAIINASMRWEILLQWGTLFTQAALLSIAYGCFAITHRAVLNTGRDLDPRYVSPSNAYDRFFIRLAGGQIEKAGLYAYAAETLAFVIGAIALTVINP